MRASHESWLWVVCPAAVKNEPIIRQPKWIWRRHSLLQRQTRREENSILESIYKVRHFPSFNHTAGTRNLLQLCPAASVPPCGWALMRAHVPTVASELLLLEVPFSNKQKQNTKEAQSPCSHSLPPGWPDIFGWERRPHLHNALEFTAWGLGRAQSGLSPQKSPFPNSVTQPKRSVPFPGFASRCQFETKPVQSGSGCWKASPGALHQTKMLALLQPRSVSCYCIAVSPLSARQQQQQQQRGFTEEIPHLQLPLSGSLPASSSTVTAAWRKKNNHFLFFVLQQKNRLLSTLAVVETENSEVTKLNSYLENGIIKPQWPHLDISGTKFLNKNSPLSVDVLDWFCSNTFQFPAPCCAVLWGQTDSFGPPLGS